MLQNIRDHLVYWDHIAWFYLNTRWHNGFLDAVLPFTRNQWTWTPLYFFLLLFIPYRFGKKGWIWCLAFLITFIVSDQISASLLKPVFHRLRPCNSPLLSGYIHMLVPCGGQYGFPSSHASNHFAIGIFTAITLHKYAKWIFPVAIFWGLLVSYSQIYVGVHYPLDVAFGGFIGIVIGIITGKFFNIKVKI